MNFAVLQDYGIDYSKGISRCLDDEQLYETVLNLFLKDTCMTRAQESLASEDYVTLFDALHELKGACGNAAMTDLYDAICPIVEQLRHVASDGLIKHESIYEQFEIVKIVYNKVCKGINIALK